MKYIKSVEEFKNEIKKDRVLVDFYADWCGPCRMLEGILEEVDNEKEELEIIKVNTDDFLSLAKEYKILAIPALKLFEKGKMIAEKEGFLTKKELLEWLDKSN